MDESQPERPGPDADASEIAEWMEQDFERAISEGIIDALQDDDQEDASDEGDGS